MPNSLSIRWKILVSLLALAIIPMLLLTYLFTNMTNEQVDGQMELMADQSGRFIIQSVSRSEQLLRDAVGMMSKDEELLNAVYFSQLTGDPEQLHSSLLRYRQHFNIDAIELLGSNGHLHRVTTSPDEQGQVEVIKGKRPATASLNSDSVKVSISNQQLHLLATTPIKLQSNTVASLRAYRRLDNQLASQLKVTVDADIAFMMAEKFSPAVNRS